MKSKVITGTEEFKPVTVEIVFETQNELANFFSRMRKHITESELKSSLPQFGTWDKSKVKNSNFKIVNKDTFVRMTDEIGKAIGWMEE